MIEGRNRSIELASVEELFWIWGVDADRFLEILIGPAIYPRFSPIKEVAEVGDATFSLQLGSHPKMKRRIISLTVASLAYGSPHVFSVTDDILAYPQVSFPPPRLCYPLPCYKLIQRTVRDRLPRILHNRKRRHIAALIRIVALLHLHHCNLPSLPRCIYLAFPPRRTVSKPPRPHQSRQSRPLPSDLRATNPRPHPLPLHHPATHSAVHKPNHRQQSRRRRSHRTRARHRTRLGPPPRNVRPMPLFYLRLVELLFLLCLIRQAIPPTAPRENHAYVSARRRPLYA